MGSPEDVKEAQKYYSRADKHGVQSHSASVTSASSQAMIKN